MPVLVEDSLYVLLARQIKVTSQPPGDGGCKSMEPPVGITVSTSCSIGLSACKCLCALSLVADH